MRAAYDAALAEYDLLLDADDADDGLQNSAADAPMEVLMQHSWEQITNTCPFNITHHPAISLPCGFGEGDRPIGLMLVAKHWQESTLYRAADAFERACNWQTVGAKTR